MLSRPGSHGEPSRRIDRRASLRARDALAAWRAVATGAAALVCAGGDAAVRGVAFVPEAWAGAAAPSPVLVVPNTSNDTRRIAVDGQPPGTCASCFTSVPQGAFGKAAGSAEVAEKGELALTLAPESVAMIEPPQP